MRGGDESRLQAGSALPEPVQLAKRKQHPGGSARKHETPFRLRNENWSLCSNGDRHNHCRIETTSSPPALAKTTAWINRPQRDQFSSAARLAGGQRRLRLAHPGLAGPGGEPEHGAGAVGLIGRAAQGGPAVSGRLGESRP